MMAVTYSIFIGDPFVYKRKHMAQKSAAKQERSAGGANTAWGCDDDDWS
jgi:hypothetical protein